MLPANTLCRLFNSYKRFRTVSKVGEQPFWIGSSLHGSGVGCCRCGRMKLLGTGHQAWPNKNCLNPAGDQNEAEAE